MDCMVSLSVGGVSEELAMEMWRNQGEHSASSLTGGGPSRLFSD